MPRWFSNLAIIPAPFPLDLIFTSGNYAQNGDPVAITSLLSISRASTGYAKTSSGTLTSFANDTLRITDLGLLVEDARTNNLKQSQTLGTSWNAGSFGATVTSDVTIAPDGTTTADKIVEDTSTGGHNIQQGVSGLGLGTLTFSVFLKAVERTSASVRIDDSSTGPVFVNIDLSSGALGTPTAVGSWTNPSATVESFTNGWWRVAITGTQGAGTVAIGIVYITNPVGTINYAGNGTSGIYMWGAQMEQASFASSYIPTTSATVTRAADLVTVIGSLNTLLSSTIPQSMVADLAATGGFAPASSHIIGIVGGNAPLYGRDDTNLRSYLGADSSSALLGGSRSFSGTGVKVGVAQDGTGFSLVGGGGTVVTGANNGGTANLTLGCGSGHWFGYFKRVIFWNSRLADATLQSLTA